MNKKFKQLGLALILPFSFAALVGAGYFVFAYFDSKLFDVRAAETDNFVLGWAWSDTIGWISLTCDHSNDGTPSPNNRNTCNASNYQVKVAPFLAGKFSGYAWADSVGWIKFDPPADSTTGTYPENPQFSAQLASSAVSSGAGKGKVEIQGWIRACTVFANPSSCSGALSTNAGGWDGWIKMSDTTNPSQSGSCPGVAGSGPYETCLTSDYRHLDGYGWGGGVVGWVQFDATHNSVFVPSSSTTFKEVRPK